MHRTHRRRSGSGFFVAAGLFAVVLAPAVRSAAPVAVGVVHSAAWSPGDVAREGAGELSVLLQVAQLQRRGGPAGLLGVGAPHGVFAPGSERALRFAALSGVAVAKTASGGDVAPSPEGLFVDAGSLPETEARRRLGEALVALGGPPRAANPLRPTAAEMAAVQAHVRRIEQHLGLTRPGLLARN